jgi:hypothetical protein
MRRARPEIRTCDGPEPAAEGHIFNEENTLKLCLKTLNLQVNVCEEKILQRRKFDLLVSKLSANLKVWALIE